MDRTDPAYRGVLLATRDPRLANSLAFENF